MRPHLIQKRKEHNMTQEEVATFLDVTTRHYQALESGDSNGSVTVWQQLAKLFNAKIDFLLSQGSDHPDYSSSGRSGIAEAKELSEAAKGFEVDVETVVDIGLDGRLDCPERRKKAERLGKALGAALS